MDHGYKCKPQIIKLIEENIEKNLNCLGLLKISYVQNQYHNA